MHVALGLLTLRPGAVGGSESYLRGLLSEYGRGNGPDQVTLIGRHGLRGAYGRFCVGPVRLHETSKYNRSEMPARAVLAMAGAWALPRRIVRGLPTGIDVTHYPLTVPVPRMRTPSVVTLYDLQHHDMPEFFTRSERLYRRWAYDAAATHATRVITASNYAKERIVKVLGVPPERIEVIPSGIDRSRFTLAPSSDEPELPDLPERYMYYPANMWPHKNHGRLLEALARVADERLHLVLSGQVFGGLERLIAGARRLGIEQRFHHLGHVTPEAVPVLYRKAQALVFPSLYEGFGAPPLEAMACGCPVASSARASLAEVCGDAALVFDPYDVEDIARGIERVAADEDLRARLRRAGIERAAAFSWERAARGHTAAYAAAARTVPTSKTPS